MKSLSFVIPVYNSERTIALVVDKIEHAVHNLRDEYTYEIILVNDYSKDNSLNVCREICSCKPTVKVLSFSKNFGQHHALMAGLRETTGDYVILMDDDLQTPPKEIGKLIDTLEQGYDVVFGQYSSKKHSALRNIGTKINCIMAKALVNKPDNIDLSSFVILRRYIVNEISKYENPFPYLAGLICRVTTNIGGVYVEHMERQFGKSNYSFKKLFSLWLNGFTNFSVKPLRISGMVGAFFALSSFIIMLILVIRRILDSNIQLGWTSLMAVVIFFGGIQLLSLGLVGEYVGRIYLCINNTPQYVIKEKYEGQEAAEE